MEGQEQAAASRRPAMPMPAIRAVPRPIEKRAARTVKYTVPSGKARKR
jgi:hypothetical protein